MKDLREIYAEKAVSQIPRLLTCLDRNPYSPTCGCFHRDYWLYKTSDFPDAVRQFGVHALALVYRYDFPGNIYKEHPKMKEWIIAAMLFWTKIQHREGSFDEFYPYERGWVGPTAFTMYTIAESCMLMKPDLSPEQERIILGAIRKAAKFILKGESEEDHLANHHAMACLAVWKAYESTGDEEFKTGFEKVWNTFLCYHNYDEGWSREYDGTDPGYLSATVSFLGKIYKTNKRDDIFRVLEQSVRFSSYFAYPNAFYAGSAGSRNTLHFYPHGYEILGQDIPLANAVAQQMLRGLSENKLVPPEIMTDRYLFYRVPEFLLSYLDYSPPRENNRSLLPWQKTDLHIWFEQSGIYARRLGDYYLLANLAKGGVMKIFNIPESRLVYNDCGMIGKLINGSIVTSQWIDPDYSIKIEPDTISVEGLFNKVPSNKTFTLFKNLIFRGVLFLLGWNPAFAHFLKGQIRKTLILGQRKLPVKFTRRIEMKNSFFTLTDKIQITGILRFESLSFGDEFFVRYVPQSRFFQSQELEVSGDVLNREDLKKLNTEKEFIREKTIP